MERLRLELDGPAPAAGQQLALFSPQLARAAQARLAARGPGHPLRGGSHPARHQSADPDALVAEDRSPGRGRPLPSEAA